MGFQERTVSELMRNRTRTYGKKPFFYFKDQVFTYEDVHDKTGRLAAALKRLGVARGDRVVVGLPNIPEIILSYTAVAKAGAAYVAIHVALSEREIIYVLNNSEAVAMIATDNVVEKVLPHLDELPYLQTVIQVGQPSRPNVIPFGELLEEQDHVDGNEQPSDIFMLSYTSGTTGNPKGAIITHERLFNNTNRLATALKMTSDDVSMDTLPYNHIFAPFVGWLPMLGTGGSFVLREEFHPRAVLQDIGRFRGTYITGVTPMYVTMLEELKRNPDRYDVTSLRFTFCAATPIPLEIQTEFERITSAPMIQAYGQTEVGPMVLLEPLDRPKGYHPGTCGTNLWEDIELKLVDSESREVPTGEPGELIVKSPDIMLGYWKMPEETAETIRDGWLHTGDVLRVDEDGYYYFVDRIKHMIKTSGKNVYPAEVEKVLMMIPEVKEVAVIGMPDPVRGESVEAFLLLHEGATLSKKQVLEYCRNHLAPYKVPRKVHFVDDFPRTVTRKIRKVEFKRQLVNEQEKISG